ncbi:S-adenosyl-L-methionine-dependent methyltransferase, partial [Zopfia rhizophila CBS 207.26]
SVIRYTTTMAIHSDTHTANRPYPSKHAQSQYANTSSKLAARLAIHTWNTHSESWFAWAGSRIPKPGHVLEVGAGTGQLWRETCLPEKLTLTDFSKAMCDELRGIRGEDKEVEVRVKQCGAEELPFEEGSFDTVVANHMLYHVDNPDNALAEFKRVLKPKSTVIVALNGMDHLDELLAIGDLIGHPSTIRNQARISAESAREYLERHFVDVRNERFPGAFEIKTVQPVVDYLGSLGEEELDKERGGRVREVVGGVIEREGVFRVSKNMVLFSGRKG